MWAEGFSSHLILGIRHKATRLILQREDDSFVGKAHTEPLMEAVALSTGQPRDQTIRSGVGKAASPSPSPRTPCASPTEKPPGAAPLRPGPFPPRAARAFPRGLGPEAETKWRRGLRGGGAAAVRPGLGAAHSRLLLLLHHLLLLLPRRPQRQQQPGGGAPAAGRSVGPRPVLFVHPVEICGSGVCVEGERSTVLPPPPPSAAGSAPFPLLPTAPQIP